MFMKQHKYVIKNNAGNIISHQNGSYIVFEYPAQAFEMIRRQFYNSPCLRVEELK